VRPDDIRQHNLSLVLEHIHRDGSLTRAELTQRLHLSRSTVGALVNDLAQLGLVEEVVPSGGARVGRPSHVVAPHSAGPYAVAVDVDVAHVTVAAVTLGGDVSAREVIAMEGVVQPPALVRVVADSVERLASEIPSPARVCGVGVSIPGSVDSSSGRIGVAPNLGWEDVPLGDLLDEVLPPGVPAVIGNDADLAVLAEHQRGNARGSDDVVFLIGRIGIGAGIIVNGAPVRGRDGHAGEIGHNVLDPTGPLCHCGKHGCIETFLGESALLKLAGRRGPRTDEKVAALFAAGRSGEERAVVAVTTAAETLGRTIASLLNTLNPERVILGGSMGEVLELARPAVEAAVAKYAFGQVGDEVVLALPAFGPDSALVGAGEVAFTRLLADPH
jgi:predicted NBD/HSP70 family sugar kinase